MPTHAVASLTRGSRTCRASPLAVAQWASSSRRSRKDQATADIHIEHNETLACAQEMAPGLAMRWPPPTMLATEAE